MTNLEIDNAYVGTDQVEKIYLGADIIYGGSPEPEPDYRTLPLTFKITAPGDICLSSLITGNTQYDSPDITLDIYKNGEWAASCQTGTHSMSETLYTISVNTGDKLEFYGDNLAISTAYSNYDANGSANSFSGSTAEFKVYGNIMSIITSSGFSGVTILDSYYQSIGLTKAPTGLFNNLFRDCTGLTDASNLILPDGTASFIYYGFMRECMSMTEGPKLITQNISGNCGAYQEFFYYCNSLETITCLALNGITQRDLFRNWTAGAGPGGTFYRHMDNHSWTTGDNGIPSGWADIPLGLQVTPISFVLSGLGESTLIDIETSEPWSATSLPYWVSLSQTTGDSGYTSIEVDSIDTPSPDDPEYPVYSFDIYTETSSITITVSAEASSESWIDIRDWMDTASTGGTIGRKIACVQGQVWTGGTMTSAGTFTSEPGYTGSTDRTSGTSLTTFKISKGQPYCSFKPTGTTTFSQAVPTTTTEIDGVTYDVYEFDVDLYLAYGYSRISTYVPRGNMFIIDNN